MNLPSLLGVNTPAEWLGLVASVLAVLGALIASARYLARHYSFLAPNIAHAVARLARIVGAVIVMLVVLGLFIAGVGKIGGLLQGLHTSDLSPSGGSGSPSLSHAHTISGKLAEYPLPGTNLAPDGIAAGPDGAMWFAEGNANGSSTANATIGRITSGGKITQFPIPGAGDYNAETITTGPDGVIWFTEVDQVYSAETVYGKIGRISSSGQITQYSLPTGIYPFGIMSGPDGALWFWEYEYARGDTKIARMTTNGKVTNEYVVPRDGTVSGGPISGPDGALWFAEYYDDSGGQFKQAICRMTTSGQMTLYPLSSSDESQGMVLGGITAGPDGALWFTETNDFNGSRGGSTGKIGRMTTEGQLTEFTLSSEFGSVPSGIAAGPDKALWFVENYDDGTAELDRITVAGQVTIYASNLGAVSSITGGPDYAIWFTEDAAGASIQTGGLIGRVA